MVDATVLSELTVEAFSKRAIRNVVLIDEQFPSLGEAVSSITDDNIDELTATYKELEIAQKLYREFNAQHLLCDVANTPLEWKERLSTRISESDLVVLDLHLGGGADSTDSIDLLRSIAISRKFNLVVVYTRDDNLPVVAYRIAGSLRGIFEGEIPDDFTAELPEVLARLDEYDCPEEEIIEAFLFNREPHSTLYGSFVGKVMQNHSPLRSHRKLLFSVIASNLLEQNFGSIPKNDNHFLVASDFKADNPWIVFENVFVVVANKNQTPPQNIIPVLEKAIVEWNPGIVRTVVAEIQNTMSRGGYAFGESLSTDLQTQIGWLWHATSSNSCSNNIDAVKLLLNRMLLGLRKNLLADKELSAFTERCLDAISKNDEVDEQINEVKSWCGKVELEQIDSKSVLHALNAYQSSEPFASTFITTGTIMLSHDNTGRRWWVCVEPACSTVPSQAPENSKFIQCQLLELICKTADADEIISNATKSDHLFVMLDGKREFLSIVNEFDQPLVRTAFVPKRNQIEISEEKHEVDLYFPTLNKDEPLLEVRRMQIVAQLHEPYANRLLHLTGHHLSRIGLDFVDLPQSSRVACDTTECIDEI